MAAETNQHINIKPSYPKDAIRKRRMIGDQFFQDGNIIVEQEAENNANSDAYFYAEVVQDTQEMTPPQPPPSLDHPSSSSLFRNHSYTCKIRDCQFASNCWIEYEEHYMNNHVHICSECLEDMQSAARITSRNQRVQCLAHTYPSQYLLDLHMEERHCAFFRLKNEKSGDRGVYSCLVEGCRDKFKNDEKRCEHLREVHGYPRWFRFHPRKRRSMKYTTYKHKINPQNSIHHVSLDDGEEKMEVERSMSSTCMSNDSSFASSHEKQQQQQKRAFRKQKQKEKRANIPCKFFHTQGRCRHGDNCMFLHSKSAATDAMDVDVDVLTGEMGRAEISIPSNLSFGRRRRR